MKRIYIAALISIVAFGLIACQQDQQPAATATPSAAPAPADHSAAAPTTPSSTTGTVVETMNAAGYTYVQVDDGQQKIWAAAPEFAVSVGDQVVVPDGMAMHNYHSQTLDRDFSVVYFVESVLNASNPMVGEAQAAGMQMPEGHPPISSDSPAAQEIDFSSIEKAENGHRIGDVYAEKATLADKNVTLRGKVVKFSPQIMGTNWIHIQDGTGDQADGSNDLTVTSNTQVKVGDTIVASGPLTLDKDFGYGYKYNLIMENAEVTIE